MAGEQFLQIRLQSSERYLSAADEGYSSQARTSLKHLPEPQDYSAWPPDRQRPLVADAGERQIWKSMVWSTKENAVVPKVVTGGEEIASLPPKDGNFRLSLARAVWAGQVLYRVSDKHIVVHKLIPKSDTTAESGNVELDRRITIRLAPLIRPAI